MRFEATSKLQRNLNHQASRKRIVTDSHLEFGASLVLGAWDLVLAALA
jgi:hypothetical protein